MRFRLKRDFHPALLRPWTQDLAGPHPGQLHQAVAAHTATSATPPTQPAWYSRLALKPLLLKRSTQLRRAASPRVHSCSQALRCSGSSESSPGGRGWTPCTPTACDPSPAAELRSPSSTSMPSCHVGTPPHAEGQQPILCRAARPAATASRARTPQTALQHVLRTLRYRPVHAALMLAQQRALLLRTPAAQRRVVSVSGLLGPLPAEDADQLARAKSFLAQFRLPAGLPHGEPMCPG